MIDTLTKLGTSDLLELAAALRAGRVSAPYTRLSLQHFLAQSLAESTAIVLNRLVARGVSPEAMTAIIELLIVDRASHISVDDVIDLVTSGPEAAAPTNRDTAVVVRDLFAYAKKSVWIAGYAVHKGRRVFEALAERMVELPDLNVILLLDIQRGPGDTTRNADLVQRFLQQFREREWPKDRPLPKLFYFPKSLEINFLNRASLHAKCVVIDSEKCFVSSANFTEAAQSKNVEVGLLVHSDVVAGRLQRYLQTLVERNVVHQIL